MPTAPSTTHSSRPDDEAFDAARRLVRFYAEDVVRHLAHSGQAEELLKDAVRSRGHNLREVNARPLDRDDDEDMKAVSPQRSLTNRHPLSPLASSSSAAPSSSDADAGEDTRDIILVQAQDNSALWPLETMTIPESDFLISKTACERIMQKGKLDGRVNNVRCCGTFIKSMGTIHIRWARNGEQLLLAKKDRSKFYIVKDIPCDIVIGDSTRGGYKNASHAHAHSAQPEDPMPTIYTREPQPFAKHGSQLQERAFTRSRVADSSQIVPAKKTSIKSGSRSNIPRARSPVTRIAIPRGSGSSIKSTSQSEPLIPSTWIANEQRPEPSKSCTTDVKATVYGVIVQHKKQSTMIQLELDATCGFFYESLLQIMDKKFKRTLDRGVDQVRFSRHKSNHDNSCIIPLEEKYIQVNWGFAVSWLQNNRVEPPNYIYAIIERDNDSDSGP